MKYELSKTKSKEKVYNSKITFKLDENYCLLSNHIAYEIIFKACFL